jgi:thioesterase-3
MKTTIEIRVRGYHEDHFQHVNHARYIEFLEEGRWAYFEEHDLIENLFHQQGIFLAVVNMTIQYRRSVVAGDILRVETEVQHAEKRKVILSQKMYAAHSNKLVIDAEIINMFVETTSGKPVAINHEMIHVWPELEKSFDPEQAI